MTRLTKKQRALAADVEYLLDTLRLLPTVEGWPRKLWTTHLELARRDLVTSGVLSRYLVIDELLNDAIAREFFPFDRVARELWRTRRFKTFSYYILERLYLVQKADFARGTLRLPKALYAEILALNELRNALAHSFFPENRRVKPLWKGLDISSRAGFERFWSDSHRIFQFLRAQQNRAYRAVNRHRKKALANNEMQLMDGLTNEPVSARS